MTAGVSGLIDQQKQFIKDSVEKKQQQDTDAANAKAFQEKQKSRMKASQRGMLTTDVTQTNQDGLKDTLGG